MDQPLPPAEALVLSVRQVQVYTWTSYAVPGLVFKWNITEALNLDDDWTIISTDIRPLVQMIKESLIEGDPVIDVEYALEPGLDLSRPGIAVTVPLPWLNQTILIDGWHRVFRLFTRGELNFSVVFLSPEQERAIRMSPSDEELRVVTQECEEALARCNGKCPVCRKPIGGEPWFVKIPPGAKYTLFATCSEPCRRRIDYEASLPPEHWENRPGYRGM
jgi:hypothetical protein